MQRHRTTLRAFSSDPVQPSVLHNAFITQGQLFGLLCVDAVVVDPSRTAVNVHDSSNSQLRACGWVQGTGQASLAVLLQFVPAALLPYPTYAGISVVTAIQQTDVSTFDTVGASLASVPLGSTVAVTIQVR